MGELWNREDCRWYPVAVGNGCGALQHVRRRDLALEHRNWRGPIWFPLNYLLIEALLRFDRYIGDGFTIAYPSGGDDAFSLRRTADDLSARLVSLFTDDPTGSRPTFGDADRFQHDPVWHQQLLFHEYFNGDTGCGLGAPHQTGWTGLSANLICAIEPSEP